MNGIIELLTNKHWMINPDYVQGIRAMLQHNLTTHAALELPEKVMGYPVSATGGTRILADNGRYDRVEEPFINLEIINGPITRNGDACSYGSREHRDMMMMAADSPYCVGHIFLINTPGGSAWAKNDYKQAIDYAHSKGQIVVAFIDGMCASAGMYLAALCDRRFYMNPENEIGCIGVMAAFYTTADGSHNQFSDATYHELYDPQSFDKNKEIRDIANEGNSDLLVKELAELGVEFRADVLKGCPKAKDEHLHGKVFKAAKVKGILVDEQANLGEVIAYVAKKGKKIKEPSNRGNDPITDPVRQALDNCEAQAKVLSTTLNNKEMKEKFPSLFAALAVEEMQMSEEGAFMNMDLLATLNAKIEAMNKEAADVKALVESLTAEKEALTAAHEQAITELKAANDKAIEDLNAEHTAAIEAKDAEIMTLTENAGKADETLKAKDEEIAQLKSDAEGQKAQIEQLQADVDGAKASLETASATIAERDQQISDLNAQVEELTKNPGAQPAAGAAPQDNGAGAETPKVMVTTPVAKPGQSYEEMRETWKGDK